MSPIEGCNHVVNGYCGQCHKGYILSADLTTCTPDCSLKYCRNCPDGPCTQCLVGYTLSAANSAQSCVKNACNATNC